MECCVEDEDAQREEFNAFKSPFFAALLEGLEVLLPVLIGEGLQYPFYLLRFLRKSELLKYASHCHIYDLILKVEISEESIVSPLGERLVSPDEFANYIFVKAFCIV